MVYEEKKCVNVKDKSKEDDKEVDFEPPDGGWGWMVVVAAGFSNFCILPVIQSFGLIFRDRFQALGISSSETTTIINVNSAVTSCIGLANGPLFRAFSYRQVSFAGALITALSITTLSTMKTFTGVLIFFSILYGIGLGIVLSSNALALNTYFKKRRRIATGFSWTCTGVGPIVMPQIITLLMPIFGMEGTVLIYGGFAFNAVACALLLQPVSWHVKKKKDEIVDDVEKVNNALLNKCHSKSLECVVQNSKITRERRMSQGFGSQYLYYDDEEVGATGIDVIGPGTPMISRANDGWFSRRNASNISLSSNRTMKTENSQKALSRYPSLCLSRQSSLKGLSRDPSVRTLSRQNSETEGRKRKTSVLQSTVNSPLIIVNESCERPEEEYGNENCKNEESARIKLIQKFEARANPMNGEVEKMLLDEEYESSARQPPKIVELRVSSTEQRNSGPPEFEEESRDPWYRRFFEMMVIFFDLDLLRDYVYVNLMLGITFANFTELNFSLLTPFILSDYGFTKIQVATVMSILAGVDVVTRITIPFIASCIDWENRTFFLVGICIMAMGRLVLAHVENYYLTLAVAIFIGAGKALRTIFMALVIPSHVPLKRLPAATGLQLLVSGIVFLALGPIVGWIKDSTGNYSIVLHSLNIFTYLTVLSWTIEVWLTKKRERNNKIVEGA